MAMYEYRCKTCGSSFELLRSMSKDDADVVCSKCGSPKVQRKISLFSSKVKESSKYCPQDVGGNCDTGMCGCNGPSCSF